MKEVLFVAFEALPFIKTGGLADVAYALPRAIDKKKFNIRVVLPLLKPIKDKYYDELELKDRIIVNSGYINEEANIYTYTLEDIEYFFIENETYFDT